MGSGNADIFRVSPHSLYRFSHRIPSFKMTGVEARGLPNDAYELRYQKQSKRSSFLQTLRATESLNAKPSTLLARGMFFRLVRFGRFIAVTMIWLCTTARFRRFLSLKHSSRNQRLNYM
uniref:Uncharacterized protein n=1 Tax=Noccaea caerulescens TaxID=107243 RepID=A0A1J3H4I1_NOCCA